MIQSWLKQIISLTYSHINKPPPPFSHGKKWVFVGKKLNRLADACRDKYREQCEDYSKGRWKDEETEALKNIIREHLGVPPSTTMVETGKMVSDQGISLPWEAITKRMGTRSRLSCYKKFQKMANLLSPSDRKIVEKRQSKSSKARKKSAAAAATAATPDAHTFVEDDDNNMNAAGDIDMDLLSELIATGASRSSEVDWNALHIDDAQNRWHALIGEWQQQEGEEETDEALTSLPLFELAQLLLDRKSSARAAETVEAVDLPNPSTLLV